MAHSFIRSLSEHLLLAISYESTMIVAWVLSLLTLLSMLVIQLERLAALEVMSVNTYAETQKGFIAAEKPSLNASNIFLISPSYQILLAIYSLPEKIFGCYLANQNLAWRS